MMFIRIHRLSFTVFMIALGFCGGAPCLIGTRIAQSADVLNSAAISVAGNVTGDALAAELAAEPFRSPSAAEYLAARDQAIRNVSEVHTHLGTGAEADRWRAYLRLSSLAEYLSPLRAPESVMVGDAARPSVAAIRSAYGRLIGDHPGLERPPLLRLRESLKRLLLMDHLMADGALPARFESKRDEAVSLLADQVVIRDEAFFRRLFPLVSWFEEYEQATAWTARYRSRFSRPNLNLHVSRDAMRRITLRAIRETEPIDEFDDECRRITGQAVAIGNAYMAPRISQTDFRTGQIGDVVPASEPAVQVIFEGDIHTTMDGKEGPVRFGFTGLTDLRVEQPVVLSPDAFRLLPIRTASSTDLRTRHVTTRRNGGISRLIRKIAVREINKSLPEARRDLDEGSVERFTEAFVEDVTDEIREAETDFRQDALDPMDRSDIRPSDFQFRGLATGLEVSMTLNGGFGWAAPPLPPPPIPMISSPGRSGPDLAVRVHESAIDRLAQRMLAGETIPDVMELARKLDPSGDDVPEEETGAEARTPSPTQIDEKILVHFAADQPIVARFENDALEITLRGDDFQLGKAVIVAMNITVRYNLRIEKGQLILGLDGDPKITPPSGKGGLRFYAMKRVMMERLRQELPQEHIVEAFEMPEPADRLGRVYFETASASRGWITLTFRGDR